MWGLLIFLAVLLIAALVGTLYIFKQEEEKMKKYEEEGETAADELRRSREYEMSSLKSNIPLQLAIYGVTLALAFIVFGIYLY